MKGYIYTLEVLLAVSIILVTITFVYRSPPPQSEYDLSIIKQQVFDSLEYLNNNGDLRIIISTDDEPALERNLSAILTGVEFEAEICDQQCLEANKPPAQSIVSVDYYASGYRSLYIPRKIKVWAWNSI